ncbi:MAG: tyrosine-type recombinase/integrase [Rhodospirillaceae bacterium]|nr:tyrosine-type recombinase/integrase [Rhodospirillaceae bacterium]
MKNSTHKVAVGDITITFTLRARSPYWQARFYGDGFVDEGLRWSTKQEELNDAEQAARLHLAGMQALLSHGIDPNAKAFAFVAKNWIEDFHHKNPKQEREYKQIVRRYFIPWFGNLNKLKINSITPKDIKSYKLWRQRYWTEGPGSEVNFIEYERNGKTLRRPLPLVKDRKVGTDGRSRIEDVILRKLFEFAVLEGFMSKNEIPHFKSPKTNTKDPNSRVAFTKEQVNEINETLYSRLVAKERDHVKYQWDLITLYWEFGMKTGARPPHEITSVQWKHITESEFDGERTVVIQIEDSKTGRRPVVAMLGLLLALQMWKKKSKFTKDDDYVFTKWNGDRLMNPNQGFNKLLQEAGVTENRGKGLSQYSMRHTFITEALNGGANVYNIASQCGTSVAMIERYYSDSLPPDVAKNILGAQQPIM